MRPLVHNTIRDRFREAEFADRTGGTARPPYQTSWRFHDLLGRRDVCRLRRVGRDLRHRSEAVDLRPSGVGQDRPLPAVWPLVSKSSSDPRNDRGLLPRRLRPACRGASRLWVVRRLGGPPDESSLVPVAIGSGSPRASPFLSLVVRSVRLAAPGAPAGRGIGAGTRLWRGGLSRPASRGGVEGRRGRACGCPGRPLSSTRIVGSNGGRRVGAV